MSVDCCHVVVTCRIISAVIHTHNAACTCARVRVRARAPSPLLRQVFCSVCQSWRGEDLPKLILCLRSVSRDDGEFTVFSLFTHSKLIKPRIPLSVAKTRRLEGDWDQRGEAVIYSGGADGSTARLSSGPGSRGPGQHSSVEVRGLIRKKDCSSSKSF